MKKVIVLLLVASIVGVGISTAASGFVENVPQFEDPVVPADVVNPAQPDQNPWITGAFFLCLAVGEVTIGTLLLHFHGKRRAFDVGIVPLELEEDEIEKLFQEFMSAP